MKKMIVLTFMFSLGLGLIVACQAGASVEAIPEEYAGLENPFAGDEDAALLGQDIFMESCARCHGDDAQGKGLAPDLVASAESHNADYLYWWVAAGGDSTSMPSFSSSLSDEQIWQVITYITLLD